MPVSLPPAQAIFVRAQRVWEERTVPPFESFRIACAQTYLSSACAAGDIAEFTVRSADGRAFAQTIATATSPSRVLVHGGYITGPDGTPLGFYRALPQTPGGVQQPVPQNLAPDPLMPTIAVATAVTQAYQLTLAGVESIGSYTCDHLVLRPLRDGALYALRALWVDEQSGNVVRLVYAHEFGNGLWGTVDYRFAPVGSERIWTIVHIEADEPTGALFGSHDVHVASDLDDIAFPVTMPPADFEP